MSGEKLETSFGDGVPPDIELDWLSAQHLARGKRVSFFQGFTNSDVEMWVPQNMKRPDDGKALPCPHD